MAEVMGTRAVEGITFTQVPPVGKGWKPLWRCNGCLRIIEDVLEHAQSHAPLGWWLDGNQLRLWPRSRWWPR